jgi:hypothetical protein
MKFGETERDVERRMAGDAPQGATAALGRTLVKVLRRAGVYRAWNGYSWRNEPDAVFVWVPKCAGTSLWRTIVGCDRPFFRSPQDVQDLFPQRGTVTFGHQSYTQLVDKGLVSRDFDQRAFKFAFVRNPFDRTVSLFHYLKTTRHLHENTSFRTFCYLIRDRAFRSVGLFNHLGLSQCSPQSDWLVDSQGKLFVEFIGRFETMQEDYERLMRRLGLPAASLTHLNKTKRERYIDYYDDECREIVATCYRDDLERFDYQFGS